MFPFNRRDHLSFRSSCRTTRGDLRSSIPCPRRFRLRVRFRPPREPTLAEMLLEANMEVDTRAPSLRLVSTSVDVHHVKRVEVSTDQFHVDRHRWSRYEFLSLRS